jgi:hypothetical protein
MDGKTVIKTPMRAYAIDRRQEIEGKQPIDRKQVLTRLRAWLWLLYLVFACGETNDRSELFGQHLLDRPRS